MCFFIEMGGIDVSVDFTHMEYHEEFAAEEIDTIEKIDKYMSYFVPTMSSVSKQKYVGH